LLGAAADGLAGAVSCAAAKDGRAAATAMEMSPVRTIHVLEFTGRRGQAIYDTDVLSIKVHVYFR
jgi:hypothetical protein